MVEIEVSRNIGFCGGVNIADINIFKIKKEIKEDLFVYGALIHNENYLSKLVKENIFTFYDLEEAKDRHVVIRTHGISPQEEKTIHFLSKKVYDLTCPKVKKIQNLILKYFKKEYHIFIAGEKNHSEVKGLYGYSDNTAKVFSSLEELKAEQTNNEETVLVAQSTFSKSRFEEMKIFFNSSYPKGIIEDTLCGAATIRQDEIIGMAKEKDVVIVVGGKKSSNTLKMIEEASKYNSRVFHFYDEKQLEEMNLSSNDRIGITSGTSTDAKFVTNLCHQIKIKLDKF